MKLFLSYNTQNNAFVQGLARDLKNSGFEVFYDKESIAAGDVWTKVIQEGINASDASLVFIGEVGIGEWQNKEVLDIVNSRTKKEGYKIIPVIVPKKAANYTLPWFLSDYQWVEFGGVDDKHAFTKLVKGLRTQPEQNKDLIGKNPYKGLQSFEMEDDYCYFGRTYDLNQVFHNKLRFHISVKNHNFLAIIADSGAGKSSFVKAGILAALQKGRAPGSDTWKQIIMKPGNSPLTALSSTLKINGLITDSLKFEKEAEVRDDTLLRTIRDQTETRVLYIDQFEEVITQYKEKEIKNEQSIFLNTIARAIETEKLIVLLSLRSDYYTAFAGFPLFKSVLEKNNFTLPPIDVNKKEDDKTNQILRDIIVKPAQNAGVTVSPGLVETLINDLKEVKGKLPILQLTLDLLWKNKANAKEITTDDYAKLSKGKNIEGIIQTHADAVFNRLTDEGTDQRKADLLKKIFVPHLVEISRNGEDVRRTALLSELKGIDNTVQDDIMALVEELSDEKSRLLTKGDTHVEVVHEVIIREWPLLKGWIDERREALFFQQQINADAKRFYAGSGKLLSKEALKEANEWQKNNPDLIEDLPIIINYINDSANTIRKQFYKQLRVAGMAAVILIVLGWILYKPYQRRKFEEDINKVATLREQVEAAGGLDSVRTLIIDNNNFNVLNGQLFYFTHLDTLKIEGITTIQDVSFLSGIKSLKLLQIFSNRSINSLSGLEKLSSLTSLEISNNKNLRNLSGLEKLSSLTSLKIVRNLYLNNLSGLEKLSSLTSLEISDNPYLSSLSGLEKLSSLTSLVISYNENLRSLSGLEKLSCLTSLEISYNPYLSSLSDLEKLSSLISLKLSGNDNLRSLSGLEKLSSLISLEISSNRSLSSLSGLEKFSSLTSLEISYNHTLSSLSGLGKFSSLTSLKISGNNNLRSLLGLEKLSSLTSLEISDNPYLSSLSGLEKLSSLTSLVISNNENLRSLSGLGKFSSLTSLKLSGNNNLRSLLGLEKLSSLTSLEISYDPYTSNLYDPYTSNLSEISRNDNLRSLLGLEKLSSLTSLVISGTALSSLPGLEKLSSLTSLKISYNPYLSSLSGLEKLSSLTSLSISGTAISSLSGLEKLSSLTSLSISGTAISSLSGLEKLSSLTLLEIYSNSNLRSLSGLEKLPSLTWLQIDINTPEVIHQLYQLPKLKKLTVSENMTVQFQRLQEKNPGVKLIRKQYLY
ncbi:leucine-rich repeat domain-containing protein [Runella sp.]|uniref:nSTAND1 domain-containing NTPase n=1 Tax=Runella sp. TaxID=1960881 RepID=UPI003D0EFDC9